MSKKKHKKLKDNESTVVHGSTNTKPVLSRHNNLVGILKFGLLATAFVPLIIFRDFISPFHFGKVIIFRSWIEILAVFYVYLVLANKSYLPKTNKLFWAVTAFIAAYGFTTMFSINVYQSFWGTLERMGGFFSLLHFWVFFVMIISIFRTTQDWLVYLRLSVVASFVSVFYGFLQTIDCNGAQFATEASRETLKWHTCTHVVGGGLDGGRVRMFGTLGNTALFAGYTLVNIFFALILIFKNKMRNLPIRPLVVTAITAFVLAAIVAIAEKQFDNSRNLFQALLYVILGVSAVLVSIRLIEKLFYGFVVGISVYAIYTTQVRGTFLALIAASIVFAFLAYFIIKNRHIRMAILIPAIILTTFEGSIILFKNTDFVSSRPSLVRMASISPSTRTVQTRIWAWQAGIDGWNDSARTVILGWGPENFNVPFSLHFNPSFYEGPGSETLFDRAHNMFVEVLVTMGIVGLLSYLSVFLGLFYILFKIYRGDFDQEKKIWASLIAAATVGYIVHNLFIFDTSANFIAFFVLLGFAYFLRVSKDDSAPPSYEGRLMKTVGAQTVASFVAVVAIVSIFLFSVLPVKANYAHTRGVVASWDKDYFIAIEKMQEAMNYDTFGSYEYRHRYALFVLDNVKRLQDDERIDIISALETILQQVSKNLEYTDLDYLPYLYIGRTYIVLGSGNEDSEYNDRALESVGRALDISPTYVRSYYELAQVFINKGEYELAIKTFEDAIDLNSDVGLSWWYLAITRLEHGDFEEGQATLTKAVEHGYNYDSKIGDLARLVPVYDKIQENLLLLDVYGNLINISPNNPQFFAEISVVFARLDRIDEAVAAAKQAALIDPSYESEARNFVEGLGRPWE